MPKARRQIVLLIGVGHERVVRRHHGNIEVDKVLEERRLVVAGLAWWQFIVDMAFNVPVSVYIAGIVGFDTSRFDLLEPPLRQVDIASTEITAEILVSETEGRGERANP